MSHSVKDIKGIGEIFAAKLAARKVTTTDELLLFGATADGRESLRATTGVHSRQILRWCNWADLMRIQGIGPQFTQLLEAAGVGSLKDLAGSRAENLKARIEDEIRLMRLSAAPPSLTEVRRWITEARMMKSVLKC